MVRYIVVAGLVACSGDSGTDDGGSEDGIPQFGPGADPSFTVIATENDDELATSRDLAFHPDRTEELWIANRTTDTIVVVFEPGGPNQTSESFYDKNANHFLEEVSSIAFGDNGDWGSCQESENTYDDQAPPNYFMGPALWPGELDVFAQVNQEMANPLLGSHLDMLHESPNCMGIAHDHRNAYWVFDGYHGDLVYYDFQEPHGYGEDDHSDGIVRRYSEVSLERVPNVPGHLVKDEDSGILYVANTGAGEIVAVDTETGDVEDAAPGAMESLQEYSLMGGVEFSVLAEDFDKPSGLALDGDVLFVSENGTGDIVALDIGDGTELERITVPEGSGVMGIEIGPDGQLYYAHRSGVVARVDP
jgi:hypothetical protein